MHAYIYTYNRWNTKKQTKKKQKTKAAQTLIFIKGQYLINFALENISVVDYFSLF